MPKKYDTPPPPLPDNPTPEQRTAHAAADARFLAEGFREGASKLPASVDPVDARMKELRARAGRFLELHSPAKTAVWLALLRPAKDVIHDVAQTEKFRAAQRGGAKKGAEFIAPTKPAIVEIGERLVAMAMEGDASAIGVVFDRIEGKPGLRTGDVDPNDAEHRRKQQDLLERLTEALTTRRILSSDDATVVDVDVVEEAAP